MCLAMCRLLVTLNRAISVEYWGQNTAWNGFKGEWEKGIGSGEYGKTLE